MWPRGWPRHVKPGPARKARNDRDPGTAARNLSAVWFCRSVEMADKHEPPPVAHCRLSPAPLPVCTRWLGLPYKPQ